MSSEPPSVVADEQPVNYLAWGSDLQHRLDSLEENDTQLRENLREAIDQLTANTPDE